LGDRYHREFRIVYILECPGSFGTTSLIEALSELGIDAKKVWHREKEILKCTHFFLPGGEYFSSSLRPGALLRASPISSAIRKILKSNQTKVIGLGTGFHALTELGYLPGGLVENASRRLAYGIIPSRNDSANLSHDEIFLPICHRYARYVVDPKLFKQLDLQKRFFLKLVDDGTSKIVKNIQSDTLVIGMKSEDEQVLGILPELDRRFNGRDLVPDAKRLLEQIMIDTS